MIFNLTCIRSCLKDRLENKKSNRICLLKKNYTKLKNNRVDLGRIGLPSPQLALLEI